MQIIGKVESLWRYPVKSMRGEQLQDAFLGFAGVYGDRLYAFRSSAAPEGFPYFTAREQEQLLQFQAKFRDPALMAQPGNLRAAQAIPPGATPVYAETADIAVDVETPDGESFAIDDPRLLEKVREGARDAHQLSLLRSQRALTDCRPVSLFSVNTVRQLGEELGDELDKRRFRANIYADLEAGGFAEDGFVGRTLQIGDKARVMITDQDPRCKMITLDPDTSAPKPELMKLVARSHDGKAGVYGAVVIEGIIRTGDSIALLD